MKTCFLSRKMFLSTIQAIQSQIATDRTIEKSLRIICHDVNITFDADDAIVGLISLLDQLTNSENIVFYWFYELIQGTKNGGLYTTPDGIKVKIRTPEQLWGYLVKLKKPLPPPRLSADPNDSGIERLGNSGIGGLLLDAHCAQLQRYMRKTLPSMKWEGDTMLDFFHVSSVVNYSYC